MSRFNIRKPSTGAQFDPNERRPKSELYSPDFLSSFWPEEDGSMPRPQGRRVRKGARSFLEHDNSCQWIQYMKQPAQQPVSVTQTPEPNTVMPDTDQKTNSGVTSGHPQGDCVDNKPTEYKRDPAENTRDFSPGKRSAYSDHQPAERNADRSPEKRYVDERLPPASSAETGTAEWYRDQVCVLEKQQRQLLQQQQNLMDIMSSHSERAPSQQPWRQSSSAQASESMNSMATSHGVEQHDHDWEPPSPEYVSRSFCRHDAGRAESDTSVTGDVGNTTSHPDVSPRVPSPHPLENRYRDVRDDWSSRRRLDESSSRDMVLAMGGGHEEVNNGQETFREDNHHFPERQRSNFSMCSQAMSVATEGSRHSYITPSDSEISSQDRGGNTGEPRRGNRRRLKGDSATANAVRMEGSVDQLIYNRKDTHKDDSEDEKREINTSFDSSSQRPDRKPAKGHVNNGDANQILSGGSQGSCVPHWMKSRSPPTHVGPPKRNLSRCSAIRPVRSCTTARVEDTPPGRYTTPPSRQATPIRRSNTPHYSDDRTPSLIGGMRSLNSRACTPDHHCTDDVITELE